MSVELLQNQETQKENYLRGKMHDDGKEGRKREIFFFLKMRKQDFTESPKWIQVGVLEIHRIAATGIVSTFC